MKKSIISLYIAFQVIILLSLNFKCHNQPEKEELDEKVFVQVYCDVLTYADLIEAKSREAFVDSVLHSHNVSREEFQQTVESYSKDKQKWEKIVTQIVEELERREKALTSKGDSTAVKKQIKIE